MQLLYKGVDVSHHNGTIDWKKVKNSNVDFAIIRCGFGNNLTVQDDVKFKSNVDGCVKNNIPYAVYLYSYAKTVKELNSEVEHVLRLVKGLSPFAVFIDMEESKTKTLGKQILTSYALSFCEKIQANGYKSGVYLNEYWAKNYIDVDKVFKNNYYIWCAKYSSSAPNIKHYDIWQHTSSAKVNGITGNVDFNYMYNDIINVKKSNVYYTKYTGNSGSIVDALNSIGVDSSFSYRKKIAIKNNIKNYTGTYNQNVTLLTLLKQGKLIKV